MNTDPCPDWREEISAFQDKALSDKKMKSVAAHLDSCAACREWLNALEEDRILFCQVYAHSSASAELRSAVMENITMNNKQQKSFFSPFANRTVLAFTGTFALILLITAFVIVKSPFQKYNSTDARPTPIALTPQIAIERQLEAPHEKPVPDFPTGTGLKRPSVAKIVTRRSDSISNTDEIASQPLPANTQKDALHTGGFISPVESTPALDKTISYSEMERNYGIPGGLKMAFTVNYEMEVKQALQSAREAQKIIKKHGGFSMDFQYEAPVGGKPIATFHGKIPAKEATSVIDDIEKLGQMRTVNIGAEDITDQYRNLEEQFNKSKGETREYYKKELEKLALKHNLVDFSATFFESKAREPFTFDTLAQSTLEILRYILLALITVGVALIVLALIIAPFAFLRHLRRKNVAIELEEK